MLEEEEEEEEKEEEMVTVSSCSLLLPPCFLASLGGGTKMESTREKNVSEGGERVEKTAGGAGKRECG